MGTNIDIIILSYAKTEQLKQMTQDGINSLFASEDKGEIKFNVVVIESEKKLGNYQYPGTKTIYPDVSFGYNKYLNIGIRATNSRYVCLSNNDLIYHPGWATAMLKAFAEHPQLASANPYSENFDYDERIKTGPDVAWRHKTMAMNGVLTGWCIFVKRDTLQKIGELDEQFTFWYADNDYDLTLRKHKLRHALIKPSLVTHLFCQSHDLLDDRHEEMTSGQRAVFEHKWANRSVLKKSANLAKRVISIVFKTNG
ncbi:glycosyltransferase family 2 protein [Mucilaginibacter myungsuensis]|uniref:Glycosyltransferase family 2 protein n=1 Tax=Mucilaginibacter myungsuensis TaxID=649104 RepID=A0A929PV72_9SPHI|nr:glycosyltransferase [Mucilaginibacter myungsuensis]MBE9660829.1 glycosyltransferase family 2 protein [Mucilaginibacter myungsuensis]MDN3600876.1 glycosyltransferase [Mucilaginibacter myungsuensis]